jgi:hypothetical protein
MTRKEQQKEKRSQPESARPAPGQAEQAEEQPQKGPGVPIDVEAGERPPVPAGEVLRDAEQQPDQSEEKPREEGAEPSAPAETEIGAEAEQEAGKEERAVAEIRQYAEELKKKSMGELFSELFGYIRDFGERISHFDFSALLGGAAGAKFAKTELEKIDLNVQENTETKYETQEQSSEYVCSVLGLPKRKNPAELLKSLVNSGMVLREKREEIKNLEPGDLVFFKKNPLDTEPFLVAVVSKDDPLSIRTIPEGGGNPVETPLEKSQYYRDNWYGIIKTKQK